MMASIIIIPNQQKLCTHDMFNLTVWGLSQRCTMNPRLVRNLIFFIYIRRKLYECDKSLSN